MSHAIRLCLVLLAIVSFGGCSPPTADVKRPVDSKPNKHAHGTGRHGGVIFDFGNNHGEFTVDLSKQEATLFILGNDEKTLLPVAADKIDLTIKSPAFRVELKPVPLESDPDGKCSHFVGKHEKLGKEQEFEGTVTAAMDGKPSVGQFKEIGEKHAHGKMPKGVGGTPAESELFLKPGGIYSAADIQANGNVVPSKKFQGISWPHDDNLKPGDTVCPVTANKADPRCKWVVNGKSYEFCCTPCLDKFVKWAKTQPDKIKEPEAYIQK